MNYRPKGKNMQISLRNMENLPRLIREMLPPIYLAMSLKRVSYIITVKY
jgi:hypothetical protein